MTIFGIVITTIALVVGYGYHRFSKTNDSPIEQAAEAVIERHSGIVIDLSPEDKDIEDRGDSSK